MTKMGEFLACPSCNHDWDLICLDCSTTLFDCECLFNKLSLWCNSCQTHHEVNTRTYDGDFDCDFLAWQGVSPSTSSTSSPDIDGGEYKDNYVFANTQLAWDDIMGDSVAPPPLKTTYSTYAPKGKTKGAKGGKSTYQKCRHYHIPIHVAEDVVIYPSSMNNDARTEDHHVHPDFGLYADTGWKPAWRNEFIVFPDYGIPKFDIAIEQITWAVEYAAEGATVEIGCIGGHGRTGVILACMKVWGSYRDESPMSAADAVKWVRSNYCSHAIETDEQEWWVNYYSYHEFGEPLAKKPESQKWTSTGAYTNCAVRSHKEMEAAGATQCLTYGDKCKYWKQDLTNGTEMKPPLDPLKINNWKMMLKAVDKSKEKAK